MRGSRLESELGQGLIEFILIVAFVAGALVVVAFSIHGQMSRVF